MLKQNLVFPGPNVFQHFDRLVGELFDGSFPSAVRTGFYYKESDDGFWLKCDLPGVKSEDLNVQFKDGVAIIEVTQAKQHNEDVKYIVRERSTGSWRRSFQIPQGADEENIKAELKDGILEIFIAKKPEAKPKRIEIQ